MYNQSQNEIVAHYIQHKSTGFTDLEIDVYFL